MLFTVLVVSFRASTIWPSFDTITVLFVFQPLTCVLCSVHVDVGSLVVRLVIEPLSLVNIAITVYQTTFTVGHIVHPISFVFGSISPDLESTPMTKAVFGPLSLVNRTIIQFVGTSSEKIGAEKFFVI